MARRSPQLATPAAVAALAVLISLEVMAIGVPAAATLASSPAAILNPEFDRRAVAGLLSRLGEGVRSDDLLTSLRHNQHAAIYPSTTTLHSLHRLAIVPTCPDARPQALLTLTPRLLDLPPPASARVLA